MNAEALLKQYAPSEKAFTIMVKHSRAVVAKALAVARRWQERYGEVDLQFVEEAPPLLRFEFAELIEDTAQLLLAVRAQLAETAERLADAIALLER